MGPKSNKQPSSQKSQAKDLNDEAYLTKDYFHIDNRPDQTPRLKAKKDLPGKFCKDDIYVFDEGPEIIKVKDFNRLRCSKRRKREGKKGDKKTNIKVVCSAYITLTKDMKKFWCSQSHPHTCRQNNEENSIIQGVDNEEIKEDGLFLRPPQRDINDDKGVESPSNNQVKRGQQLQNNEATRPLESHNQFNQYGSDFSQFIEQLILKTITKYDEQRLSMLGHQPFAPRRRTDNGLGTKNDFDVKSAYYRSEQIYPQGHDSHIAHQMFPDQLSHHGAFLQHINETYSSVDNAETKQLLADVNQYFLNSSLQQNQFIDGGMITSKTLHQTSNQVQQVNENLQVEKDQQHMNFEINAASNERLVQVLDNSVPDNRLNQQQQVDQIMPHQTSNIDSPLSKTSSLSSSEDSVTQEFIAKGEANDILEQKQDQKKSLENDEQLLSQPLNYQQALNGYQQCLQADFLQKVNKDLAKTDCIKLYQELRLHFDKIEQQGAYFKDIYEQVFDEEDSDGGTTILKGNDLKAFVFTFQDWLIKNIEAMIELHPPSMGYLLPSKKPCDIIQRFQNVEQWKIDGGLYKQYYSYLNEEKNKEAIKNNQYKHTMTSKPSYNGLNAQRTHIPISTINREMIAGNQKQILEPESKNKAKTIQKHN